MAALATAPELEMSVAEYLTGDFETDVDFVDGRIEERNVGELDHSKWQVALILWFAQHKAEWGLRGFPELRIRVSATRYRVPDVCVFAPNQQPSEPIPSSPPLAVFEILSPEDRFSRIAVRLADFERMGVQNIFVLDRDETFYRFENGNFSVVVDERSDLRGSEAWVNWRELAALRL